jgi:hypothetical protein
MTVSAVSWGCRGGTVRRWPESFALCWAPVGSRAEMPLRARRWGANGSLSGERAPSTARRAEEPGGTSPPGASSRSSAAGERTRCSHDKHAASAPPPPAGLPMARAVGRRDSMPRCMSSNAAATVARNSANSCAQCLGRSDPVQTQGGNASRP